MFHFLCVLFKRLRDDEKCSNLHMCMLVTNEVVVNWPTGLIFIDIILTIKILFTINSL